MLKSQHAVNVSCVLLGATGLVLKGRYSGPWRPLVLSYGGNLAASFAVYFLARRVTIRSKHGRIMAAGFALAAVELFEALNGFGVMANVYDRADFAANAVGIAVALAVDAVVERTGRAA